MSRGQRSRFRMSHRIGNRDQNEPAIIEALQAQGFTVDRLTAPLPDLLVSKGGSMWLAEVKMPKGKMRESQETWHRAFQGPKPVILRTVDDALKFQLLAMEGGTR